MDKGFECRLAGAHVREQNTLEMLAEYYGKLDTVLWSVPIPYANTLVLLAFGWLGRAMGFLFCGVR